MCFMIFSNIITAQNTPKWAEKAKKAVFSVITYDKDNKIKNTGNGFFIGTDGTAVSDFTLFAASNRASIITEGGKELRVVSIIGINSMYDAIKFRTEPDKKSGSLKIASSASKVGDRVYLLPYSTKKADTLQVGKVLSVDSINSNSFYYTLDIKTNSKFVSCPVMNEAGEVIASIQRSASKDNKESYAIGVSFSNSLELNALSANDEVLNQIKIKKELPNDVNQAQIYLMILSSKADNKTYLEVVNDFISKFPDSSEGYQRRASYYLMNENSNNKQISEDIHKALNVGKNKLANKANVSKMIYRYNLQKSDSLKNEWNLDRSLELIKEVIKLDNQPLYVQQEGDIYFAMHKYQDAFNSYDIVNKSKIATASSFYSAAKSMQLTDNYDKTKVVSLLDSAVVRFSKPYTKEAAPYIYERAVARADAGKYREAIEDYNNFYDIVNGNVNSNFYFQRQQSEVQCKMFKQAIDDVNKAVEISPKDPVMWVEKGSVHIRVGQLNEAILALKRAISLDNTLAEAYRMLGYCQARQNNKKEAKVSLTKAKELGDKIADSVIKKYCN